MLLFVENEYEIDIIVRRLGVSGVITLLFHLFNSPVLFNLLFWKEDLLAYKTVRVKFMLRYHQEDSKESV